MRALFGAVAADGRAHNFARICTVDMSEVLPELDYLVGGNCTKDMAADWREGVQLSKMGPGTRVIVTGDTAVVFDGPAPDRTVRMNGRWQLAEFPRTKRHVFVGEACEVAESIDRGLRARHLPDLHPATGLGCHAG